MSYLTVFLGSGAGGAMRHGINLVANRISGDAFPLGTLFVNVAGSFVMGIIIEYLALRGTATQYLRFSLDTALLFERGQPEMAGHCALASTVLSIAALFLGLFAIRNLPQVLQ
jgi:fluoride exporter